MKLKILREDRDESGNQIDEVGTEFFLTMTRLPINRTGNSSGRRAPVLMCVCVFVCTCVRARARARALSTDRYVDTPDRCGHTIVRSCVFCVHAYLRY
jgi:hypothetical protein